MQITERVCLWYGSFRSRTVRVILVRDDKPRTRDGDDRGYGLPLVTTDLESSAEDLVARYASRWGIEQAFADARQIVGVGEARNRTRRAVERTVPFGLIGFSVVTVWYALHGHAPKRRDQSQGSGPLVHHEGRAVLRRHGRQTSPRHHRRQISRSMPRAGHPARNPGRPRSLGRSRDLINKTCETRASSPREAPFFARQFVPGSGAGSVWDQDPAPISMAAAVEDRLHPRNRADTSIARRLRDLAAVLFAICLRWSSRRLWTLSVPALSQRPFDGLKLVRVVEDRPDLDATTLAGRPPTRRETAPCNGDGWGC